MFAFDKLLRKCDLNALTGGMAIRSNRKATQENEEGTSGQGSGLFPWWGVFALAHQWPQFMTFP